MSFYYAKDNERYIIQKDSKYISIGKDGIVALKEYASASFIPFDCIIGIVNLKINKYLIIGEKSSNVGTILDHSVFKVDKFKILPISNYNKDADEATYLGYLNSHLKSSNLYYSSYDLTNSLQRNSAGEASIDERFWWNEYLSGELTDFPDFSTTLINGYVKIITTSFNSFPVQFGLITRRSKYRAGTRYFRRGIDSNGNVANFNETEQILAYNKDVFGFLQTRGSVPIKWTEINNLKYRPNLKISKNHDLSSTALHFNEQVEKYGENYLVNLVNQKGYEKPVKDGYENVVAQLGNPSLHYVYFDFHHECSKMRWDRVKLLIDNLVDLDYSNGNCFHLQNGKVVATQNKIVRTNCMDCLDRTNVVQSTLGRWFLQGQFEKLQLIEAYNQWESDNAFNLQFQNIWADNADFVSLGYSGTGALKTDYTRTGKRTKKGALNDLINSIMRYYKNNYKDGPRQDSFDLFLGNFAPSSRSPFQDSRPPLIQSIPYLLVASITILMAVFMFPKGEFNSWRNFGLIGGCTLCGLWCGWYLSSHGRQFVNWPKFVRLDFLKYSNKDGLWLDVSEEFAGDDKKGA